MAAVKPLVRGNPLLDKTIVLFWCREDEELSPEQQRERLERVQDACRKRNAPTRLCYYAAHATSPWRLYALTCGDTSSSMQVRLIATRLHVHSERQDITSLTDLPASDPIPV